MMETLGIKGVGSISRVAPAAPVSPTSNTAPATTAATTTVAQSDPMALSRSLAASPPVNADRVSEIRAAIAKGRFPLLPSTIADQMIALKLAWNPNDKA
jgi:negative regulator of flagellin synthesis FlgM